MLRCAGHLRPAFDLQERETHIDEALRVLQEIDFDTIVVSGLSGIVPGSIVAHAMGKKLAVVRRKGEIENTRSGSANAVEGHIGGKWIFLDDFTSCGVTRAYVKEQYTEAYIALTTDPWYSGDLEPLLYVGMFHFNCSQFAPELVGPHQPPPADSYAKALSKSISEWKNPGATVAGEARWKFAIDKPMTMMVGFGEPPTPEEAEYQKALDEIVIGLGGYSATEARLAVTIQKARTPVSRGPASRRKYPLRT